MFGSLLTVENQVLLIGLKTNLLEIKIRTYFEISGEPNQLHAHELWEYKERKQNKIVGMRCPKCQPNWKQYKAGFNVSGS